jgi:hypothetical protein
MLSSPKLFGFNKNRSFSSFRPLKGVQLISKLVQGECKWKWRDISPKAQGLNQNHCTDQLKKKA